ncbi:hypothetical protein LTS08_007963 [Lithohypha guttulata]|uniref:uncharacterized protein n=1 Tax=Lithohypha guttulata TaxID=1690604 RepID=UPI002DDF2AAA|nr:hypothetical protein LTR51_007985 [Lithohypha guttulata]KAK5095826.1 hypothetical protein LTS08_007963 [Lithohypha guttulata]
MSITEVDLEHLRRCVQLAAEALSTHDDPFGSVLYYVKTYRSPGIATSRSAVQEDRNRIISRNDATYHPEIKLALWAQANLTEDERAKSVLYTSGEHCPMCAAAHAWCGLGRIVYASSAAQLAGWMKEMGMGGVSPVKALAIKDVAPYIEVDGPVEELAKDVKKLHFQKHRHVPKD